ncbi:MAG: thioredoxin family protein [Candidatus Omnitrophota bacterium]|nr:thioredoxin family protein [Candidatus Omnitrophota bacterium]
MSKRKVEIFTSGCYLCEETVSLVKELACSSCEVEVYDISEPCESEECADKAKAYGINSVPAVVIDGKIAECCKRGKPDREALLAAGLGTAL